MEVEVRLAMKLKGDNKMRVRVGWSKSWGRPSRVVALSTYRYGVESADKSSNDAVDMICSCRENVELCARGS